MANTYTLIDKTTVGSGGVSSISFTAIPSSYTDLKLTISGRTNRSATFDNLNIGFNNSQNNFTGLVFVGYGSSGFESASAAQLIASINANNSTSSVFTSIDIYIPNYGASTNKSFSAESANENNDGFAVVLFGGGLWSNSSPISSIQLYPVYGTAFVEFTSAYLYGIKKS